MKYTFKMFLIDQKILRTIKKMYKRGINVKGDLIDHIGELYEFGYDYMADCIDHRSSKIPFGARMFEYTINKYEEVFEMIGIKRNEILSSLIDYWFN